MPSRIAQYQQIPTATLDEQQRADAAAAWAQRQRAAVAADWAAMHEQDAHDSLGPLVQASQEPAGGLSGVGSADSLSPSMEGAFSPNQAPFSAAGADSYLPPPDTTPSFTDKSFAGQPDAVVAEEAPEDQPVAPDRPPFGMEGLLNAGPFGLRTPTLPPVVPPNLAPPDQGEQERVLEGRSPVETGGELVGKTAGFLGRQLQSQPGVIAEGVIPDAGDVVRQQEARGGFGGGVGGLVSGVGEAVSGGPGGLGGTAKQAAGEVERLRLDKFPEAVRDTIAQAAERGDHWLQQRRNVIPDAEAERMADEIGKTADEMIAQGRAGRAYNTEETRALRNSLTGQALKVDDLKATVEALGDQASDALKRELGQEEATLLALSRVAEGARAEAGRAFRAYLTDTRGRLARARGPQYTSISRVPTASAASMQGPGRATPALTEQAPLITEPVARSGRATNLVGETRREGSGPSAYDRASLVRYAGMLSAVPTHLLNAAGNFVAGGTSLLAKPAQVGVDLARVGAGRVLGKDVERQRFMAEVLPQVDGYMRGLWAGAKQVPGILAHGAAQDFHNLYGTRSLESGSRVLDTAVEAPLRALAASDALFRSASLGGHSAALAVRQATQEGLSGLARTQRAQEILGNISDHPGLIESANKLAARDVFQEARAGTEALGRVRSKLGSGGEAVFDLALPFFRTPYNVAAQGAGMTPAGFASAYQAAKRGETGEAVDRVTRAVTGTAGLAFGLNLAAAGMLTGRMPSDPSDRSTLPEGWKPWSLRVPSGDGAVYVPLQALGGWAVPLAVAASVTDARKAGRTEGDPSKVVLGAVGSVGKFMLDMSAFQGLNTLTRIVEEPERYAERAAEGITSSFVPASGLLRTVQQAAGEPARDPNNALEAMLAQVPGLSSLVPTAQTSLGADRSRGVPGPLGLVVGSRVTAEAPSSVLAALREANVGIPEPPRTVSHENVTDIPLTQAEQRAYRTRAGQELSKRVEKAIANPKWAQGSPADRADFLEQQVRDAREAAKLAVLKDMGKDEIKRRLARRPAA